MSRQNFYWLLGIVAVSLLGITVSYSSPTKEKNDNYELVHLFVDVLQQVEEKYVIPLDGERRRKLAEDMINGGLEKLDQHSAFMSAREYKQFRGQSDGQFGGIGIEIGFDRQNRGQLIVASPMPGTPAFDAGVQADDMILKINGKSTESMQLKDAIDAIKGEKGQKVTLTVLHEGEHEPVDIDIVRSVIHVPCVLGDQRKTDGPKKDWDYLYDKEAKIGYVRLTGFTKTASEELREALDSLQKEKAKGLILDLRNNPGGLLKEAVFVSNLFIKEGRVVSTKDRTQQEEIYDARPERAHAYFGDDVPLVILVNKFSASASEIVSAALQDHKRAIVIGERSYGKGSVQNIIPMEGDTTSLKLTTASYWRPSGKNIHRFPDSKETDEWGVKPNEGFEVPMKDEERLDYMVWRRDRDIYRSKKPEAKEPEPVKKDKEGKDGKEAKPKKPFKDRVMEKALDYLRKEIDKGHAERLLERGNA
jgi:carboxyl-terminal processing protease